MWPAGHTPVTLPSLSVPSALPSLGQLSPVAHKLDMRELFLWPGELFVHLCPGLDSLCLESQGCVQLACPAILLAHKEALTPQRQAWPSS